MYDGHTEETGPDENGVRTVTQYRRNPVTGAKEKVVRKYKRETRIIRISRAAEERAAWRRFGKAADGNEGTSARSYDDIHFEVPGVPEKDDLDKLLDGGKAIIVCRKCGAVGDHYTLKCPLKDFSSDVLSRTGGVGSGFGMGDSPAGPSMFGEGDEAVAVGGAGKYVPPSRRGGPEGVGAKDSGAGARGGPADTSDLNGLRVSNLSEDADEDELRGLFRQVRAGVCGWAWVVRRPLRRRNRCVHRQAGRSAGCPRRFRVDGWAREPESRHACAGPPSHASPYSPYSPSSSLPQYGHIERFFIARDRETGVSRGFAFITFSSHSEADRARIGMNNYPYLHLILKVSLWAASMGRANPHTGAAAASCYRYRPLATSPRPAPHRRR